MLKFYSVVNVGVVGVFAAGTEVDLQAVLQKGLTSKEKHSELFKILGDGELSVGLTVKVDAITKTAREKIEKAGGAVVVIEPRARRPKFIAKDGSKRTPGAPRIRRGRAPRA